MRRKKETRPHIPKATQNLLWLRAGGRCEFRGCNELLYEDVVTTDPINESNIAHIISWKKSGPRGDEVLSPKLVTSIENLMLTCPRHNHLIDSGEQIDKYTVSFLQDMKREHEQSIRELTALRTQLPKRVIELKSLIHGHRPSITEREEADALFPFFPKRDRIVIDVCDFENLETAKAVIKSEVERNIINRAGDELYAAFIMALMPLGCYLGYAVGNIIPVQTFQHFRDSEDWKWRSGGGGFSVQKPEIVTPCENVNLLVNVSGTIEKCLIMTDYPVYSISADDPGFDFLQSWDQVVEFRKCYRDILDCIRLDCGENVLIHLYAATPNPINFEIGKSVMKNLDPSIIIYDKASDKPEYKAVMKLHDRIRLSH